jgi:hypothetical protein
MRIDHAGIPLPEPTPEPVDLRFTCPTCGAPTWPHTNPNTGQAEATLCLRCQLVIDRERGFDL